MATLRDTYKVSELVEQSGTYVCANCRRMSKNVQVRLSEGDLFPACTECTEREVHEVDMMWKHESRLADLLSH